MIYGHSTSNWNCSPSVWYPPSLVYLVSSQGLMFRFDFLVFDATCPISFETNDEQLFDNEHGSRKQKLTPHCPGFHKHLIFLPSWSKIYIRYTPFRLQFVCTPGVAPLDFRESSRDFRKLIQSPDFFTVNSHVACHHILSPCSVKTYHFGGFTGFILLDELTSGSPYLLGGVEREFYFPFHIWDVIFPIDELHHFSEGYVNHQPDESIQYGPIFH